MSYTAECAANINAIADAISAVPVGGGVTVSVWTDAHAYTVVKKTRTTMTLRADSAKLINRDELRFFVGGFGAHCENQSDQRYEYAPDPNGAVIKISLRRWADEEGNERRRWKKCGVGTFASGGSVSAGRHAYRDFNF